MVIERHPNLTFVDAIAHDGPALARPCLAVREQRRVEPIPGISQHAPTNVVKYLFLDE